MNEEFLYYLWTYQLFRNNLITSQGESVRVISTGTRNTDSGPDFFNALIEIGETKWAGNIEIHVLSSDWFRHNHQSDPLYDSIILHVVYKDDSPVKRVNNELIPTVALCDYIDINILEKYKMFINSSKAIPCGKLLGNVRILDSYGWLDKLMVERLECKSKEIIDLLEITNGNLLQSYYQSFARSLGYVVNSNAMEMLARSTPIKLLLKHIDSKAHLEALLYGQSGLLNSKCSDSYKVHLQSEFTFLQRKYSLVPLDINIWRFMRMRPVSFPTIRISQLASIIYNTSGELLKIFEIDKVESVQKLLSLQVY